LHTGLLEGDIFVQVTPKSVIQIQGHGESRRRTKWESEKGRILMACSNTRQVVIFIEGGQIVYFQLDDMTGSLNESHKQFYEVDVRCIDIGEVPEGRQRCKFLVVGFQDSTVRVLSLEPESCLQRISTQALPSIANSVSLMTYGGK
jgi:splicing factor 3B subunit 3